MRITIEAGTRGWFEVQFNGLGSVIFNQDTTVNWNAAAPIGTKPGDRFPTFRQDTQAS